MKNSITKHPFISLFCTALLCGIIWRAEVEYHGWSGLIWLDYFHMAIPIGFVLFLVWANFFVDLVIAKRMAINITAGIFGIALFYLLALSLNVNFAAGPGAMFLLLLPAWKLYVSQFSIFFIVAFISFGTWLILRLFKIRVKAKFMAFSIIAIFASVPLSVLILQIINDKGPADVIHTLKTGVLIPLWIISVGILFIYQNKKPTV